MISLAQLIVDRAAQNLSTTDAFEALPAFQMRVRFDDLCALCPSRIELEVERRPANALNVEIGTPVPRCRLRSPDGRGSAWLLSGGSPLAYGVCSARECPRAKQIPCGSVSSE